MQTVCNFSNAFGLIINVILNVILNKLCQNVDIVITDKDDKVVKVYEKVKPEKIIFPKRYGYNVYFMPLGFGEKFKHNEKIKLKENNS